MGTTAKLVHPSGRRNEPNTWVVWALRVTIPPAAGRLPRVHAATAAFYCGISLHARTLYLRVIDRAGAIHMPHRRVPPPYWQGIIPPDRKT